MADYTYNSDKRSCASDYLYNSVLSTVFTNEGAEPLTLQEAKNWGKIEQDTDDVIITALITAARRMCESYSGIGFISRTITAVINNSNGGFMLPYGPVTVDPTGVDVDSNDLTLTYQLSQLSSPSGVMQVTYTAGYAVLPEDLKTALKCQFLFLYENRGESDIGLSPISKMILEPLRVVV